MRIALLGGSGFIGTSLVRELGPSHGLLVVDKRPLPGGVTGAEHASVELTLDSLEPLLRGVDGAVLLAGRRAGKDRRAERFADYLPSIEIAARVFDACRAAGARNVVSLSSIAVYGRGNVMPWSEEQVPKPETYYGVMKTAVETLGALHSREGSLAVKSLRVAQVVGPGEREGFMLDTFIRRAANHEPPVVWGAGQGRREYVHVRDVAGAVLAALEHPDVHGAFNVGSGKNTSHRELAELVNETFGNVGNIEFLPDRPDDRSEHLMDPARTRQVLGWSARWSLAEALQDVRTAPPR